jgi:hypothetical protein
MVHLCLLAPRQFQAANLKAIYAQGQEQELLVVFLSVKVKLLPDENTCTEALPLFEPPSYLASTLRSIA